MKSTNYNFLNSDKFCYLAAWNAIIRFGFVAGDYKLWFSAISPLTTLPREYGLDLALKLSRNSPNYKSDADVIKKYDEIVRTNKSKREYFLRYFKYCKDKMGKDWIRQIQVDIKDNIVSLESPNSSLVI